MEMEITDIPAAGFSWKTLARLHMTQPFSQLDSTSLPKTQREENMAENMAEFLAKWHERHVKPYSDS